MVGNKGIGIYDIKLNICSFTCNSATVHSVLES